MGKLGNYGAKTTPVLLTDKTAATDGVTTFDLSLQNIKDIAGGVSNHNDLNNLNVGDYLHFTAAEKANFIATKVTTVGTGGEYATVGAAVAAGKQGSFLLISNVTETGNILSNDKYINITSIGFGVTWNLAGYYFTESTNVPILITCSNMNITTSSITIGRDIYTKFTNCYITITASATISDCHFDRCIINLPNYYITFIDCYLLNSYITGGGSILFFLGNSRVIGNNFSGTFSQIRPQGAFDNNSGTLTTVIYMNLQGNVSNSVSGNNMPNATINSEVASVYARFTNNIFKDILTSASVTASYFDFANCKFTGAFTVKFICNFSNCKFDGTIIVAQKWCTFIGCHVGSVNAGTKTITINATIDKTIITACRTESAIVDNGTNTSINNNLLF